VASNALMLLGALGVASSPVRPGGSTAAHVDPPKTTTPEPPKTPTPGEPTKPPVAVDPPKTPTPGEPTKPPLKVAPPDTASTCSPADARKYLEQHGLTSKEIKGLAGERISQPRAALIERLAKHFTEKDLKVLADSSPRTHRHLANLLWTI
jgi:hypothetical protein